jgi:hypothetical protein
VAREDWLAARVREFAALRGRTVRTWTGVEMAFFEDPPRFEDPRAPFLQLLSLDATLDGETLAIVPYQDDDVWGLLTEPARGRGGAEGIYRERSLSELPTGDIDDVTVRVEDGVLAEVSLCIGARPLLLLAGEAYEDRGDNLVFHRRDSSVLAFTDPTLVDTIPWYRN